MSCSQLNLFVADVWLYPAKYSQGRRETAITPLPAGSDQHPRLFMPPKWPLKILIRSWQLDKFCHLQFSSNKNVRPSLWVFFPTQQCIMPTMKPRSGRSE